MTLESVIQVRLTNDDLKELKDLAKKERLNISAYCRKELSRKFETIKTDNDEK